jgi:AcrR family transcriptional regulator
MSRRRYTMGRRALALEETRRRILKATMQVHDEQGMADARWEEIALRAGVSLSTIYRHFPSNDELIAACGRLTFEEFPPPDPADAANAFRGIEGRERLKRLVEVVFGYYERTDPMMTMARRDLHRSNAVAQGFEVIHGGVEAFIVEALKPLRISESQAAAVRAFLDDRVYASFMDAGMDPSFAKEEGVALLRRATGL